MPLDPLSATELGAAAGSGGLAALFISLFNKWTEGRKYERLDDKVDNITERTARLEVEVHSMDQRQVTMVETLEGIRKGQQQILETLARITQRLDDNDKL